MVAENVKRIIDEKGLKQKAVAFKAGYSEKKLSELLCGRATMREGDIKKLAIALNVTPNELFGIM